MGMKLELSH